MTYIGIIFLLLIIVVTLFRQQIIEKLRSHALVRRLSQAEWFESHWNAGIFLFIINVVLVGVTLGLLALSALLTIPYFHFVLMALAGAASLYLWICVGIAWDGEKADRMKMALAGSSWYLLLTIGSVTGLMTMEATAELDSFMAAVAFVFSTIVSIVAFTYCFLITGFWSSQKDPD